MKALVLAAAAIGGIAGAVPDPATMDEATFERELERRFQYGPPELVPTEVEDQAAGQVADAAYFTAFPDHDRSFSPLARAQARRLAERLREQAGGLSHEQFVLRVAEIAALADNAHTALGDAAFQKNTPRLPLRTFLFAEGLHVLRATAPHADLLGARIDAIDGQDIESIYRALRRFRGGTEPHRRLHLLPILESPALLEAAGIARERSALTLRGLLADGTPFERRVEAEERGRAAPISSTIRLLFPRRGGAMASFLSAESDLPAWLRLSSSLFTTAELPGRGLHIGLTFNADGDEEPIAPFLERVLARIRGERTEYVVLDMRMNGGGDYTKTYPFARALPEAAAGAQIYVLTSPWTFSAAITTVAALEEAGGERVTIVGEPVGDRLDFWAEGSAFVLPNAFLTVHYATGRHNYAGPCDDRETCFWLNRRYPVRVRTLEPDVRAPLAFAAYRDGRDPAVEAVLEREGVAGANRSD